MSPLNDMQFLFETRLYVSEFRLKKILSHKRIFGHAGICILLSVFFKSLFHEFVLYECSSTAKPIFNHTVQVVRSVGKAYKRQVSATPANVMCIKVTKTERPCSLPQVFLSPLSAALFIAGIRTCRFGSVVAQIIASNKHAVASTK